MSNYITAHENSRIATYLHQMNKQEMEKRAKLAGIRKSGASVTAVGCHPEGHRTKLNQNDRMDHL